MEDSKKDVGKSRRRMMTFGEYVVRSLGLHEASVKRKLSLRNADPNKGSDGGSFSIASWVPCEDPDEQVVSPECLPLIAGKPADLSVRKRLAERSPTHDESGGGGRVRRSR